jgi:hypothetical protein
MIAADLTRFIVCHVVGAAWCSSSRPPGTLFGIGLVVLQVVRPRQGARLPRRRRELGREPRARDVDALAVAVPGFRLARARSAPVLHGRLKASSRARIERKLLAGAALFGVGWVSRRLLHPAGHQLTRLRQTGAVDLGLGARGRQREPKLLEAVASIWFPGGC